jgi:hypothetical protein
MSVFVLNRKREITRSGLRIENGSKEVHMKNVAKKYSSIVSRRC